MDLLQTVRKEGSRGGRAEFKWEDVKNDAQRENYLGHSVMAPVGRWQQGRDLSWYTRGDVDSKKAEAERIKEEKRKLKEAEEDAMLAAMGLPVPKRASDNANLTPLGEKAHEADVDDAMRAKAEHGEDERAHRTEKERSRRHRDDDRERRRRHRSRSRSRDRGRRHRHRDRERSRDWRRDDDKDRRRHRSRSREHTRRDERPERRRRRASGDERSRSRSRSRSRDRRPRRDRSRSPYETKDKRRD